MATPSASPNSTETLIQNGLFQEAQDLGFGELHFKVDEQTGLWAIVAIHDTTLGPALGGCRCKVYDNSHEAITDALRLAQGMTYKAAIAGVNYGGGKAVLLKPKTLQNREAYFASFGAFVNDLGGRYITAKDVGTDIHDMDAIATQTHYVTGTSKDNHRNGDPSPYTALGVCAGIQAAVKFKLQRDTLEGVHIAIQGLGHVGYHLAKFCHEKGAKLTVTDMDPKAIERVVEAFGARAVPPEAIISVKADVFAPCALGAVIHHDTLSQLQAPIVAGGANNQLATEKEGETLKEQGILYAPDFVINSGGLIHAVKLYEQAEDEPANAKILNIHDVLMEIFERSEQTDLPTNQVAIALAKEKLSKAP